MTQPRLLENIIRRLRLRRFFVIGYLSFVLGLTPYHHGEPG